MSVAAHQEKQKNEKTGKTEAGEERRQAKQRQEKREDRRPTVKKLHAALLRSFREQHGVKMVCARGVPGVIGTLGRANSHFEPTQMGPGTALPRLGGC